MSMISGQIDKLRKAAQTERGLGHYELEQMLLDAADTIWELRDDLQRANAENAKLREELADAPKCDACEAMLDCDECLRADGSHKERRRLKAENARLRELVCWMYDRMDESCAVQYPHAPTPISYDRLMQAQARARELGVEVE